MKHGTTHAYNYHRCRCVPCCRAHADRVAQQRIRRAIRLADDAGLVGHGLDSTYTNWGCRCEGCTTAHALMMSEYRAWRTA